MPKDHEDKKGTSPDRFNIGLGIFFTICQIKEVGQSQETYLTDKTTYPTEGKGGYYEKRHEKNSVLMSMIARRKVK
jgi:hypothetical protein